MFAYEVELERTVTVVQRASVTVNAMGRDEAVELALDDVRDWRDAKIVDSDGTAVVDVERVD